MSAELLEHNQLTFEEVENYINKGQDCCVVNPCGSGKTFVMAAIINTHADKTFTLVTKQSNAKAYYMRKDEGFSRVNIITYNKLLNDFKANALEDYATDFMLLDEAHYMGAEKWFLPIGCIKKRFNPIMIGFTATPQRFQQQGTNDSIVTDYFQGNSAGNFTSKDLRKKGLFVEPECVVSYYNLDMELDKRVANIENSDMDGDKKGFYITKLNNIREQWEKESNPSIIINRYVPNYFYKESCNRILVYSPSMTMLESNKNLIMPILKEMLKGKAIKTYDYTYKTDRKAFDEFLIEDDSYVKVLFSIDKIMETIHIDDLNIVIMLRPSVSNRIITQQYGRVNNVSNTKKALILDFVGNIDTLNSVSFDTALGKKGEVGKVNKTSISINLHHIGIYQDLFSQIDKCLQRYPVYTYNNLTGSASFFANVYSCDKAKLVEKLTLGFDMEDAIAFSKVKEKKLSQNVFDNKRVYEVAESGPELSMDVLTDIVADFIKHRHIVDEDMQQDLYVLAYSKAYSTRMEVMSRLNSSYTIWCRTQRRHDEVFVPYIEENLPLKEEETEFKNVYDEQLRDGFDKAIESRCTEREKTVLTEYFGRNTGVSRTLYEVAALNGVTSERVRQIVNKALRKLRHPSLTKYYKDWVDNSYHKTLPKVEKEDKGIAWLDFAKKELAKESKKVKKKPDLHYDNATLIELLRFYDIYEIADEISSRKGVYEKAKILAVKETTDFMKQFDFKGIRTGMYIDIKDVVSDILLYKSMKPKALKQKVESLVIEIRLNEDKNVMHSITDYEDYQYLKSMLPK